MQRIFDQFNIVGPDWPDLNNKVVAFMTRATNTHGKPVSFVNAGCPQLQTQQALEQALNPEHPIVWAKQVHGTNVISLPYKGERPSADGMVTTAKRTPCVAVNADCLIVLLAAKEGSEVAAAHAGWRGLSQGILTETLRAMKTDNHNMIAWLSPAICADCFEVGAEVKQAFLEHNPKAAKHFKPKNISRGDNKFLCDLHGLATQQLQALGVLPDAISRSELCTMTTHDLHSHRRDGPQSGRTACVIMRL